jgi:Arc/MetJ family transcription regulator
MKRYHASHSALIQAVLEAEGLTLAEQKEALHAALTAVIRKQMTETHARAVDAARKVP